MSRQSLSQIMRRLPRDEALALYARQTSYLQTVINNRPKALNVLSLEDREVFKRYFFPDWIDAGHFVRYYSLIERTEPELIADANYLLITFMDKNRLGAPDVFPRIHP